MPQTSAVISIVSTTRHDMLAGALMAAGRGRADAASGREAFGERVLTWAWVWRWHLII